MILHTFDTLITCKYVRFKIIRAGVVSFEEGLYIGNMTLSFTTAVLCKKGSYISAKRIKETEFLNNTFIVTSNNIWLFI